MDLFTAIEKRYSHKERFLAETVPLEHLEKIAKAGLAAPTGNNTQNVKMVILPNRKALQPLCDIAPTEGMKTAQAAIAIFTDSIMRGENHNFDMENYAAAAQNVFLAATALEYATVWLDFPFFDKNNQKNALKALKAPTGLRLHVVFPIGKPEGKGTRRKKMPYEDRLFYETF